ncbi:MAG: DUF6784 domain-containing protein, partial [Phycisphaeraceae bacterium]
LETAELPGNAGFVDRWRSLEMTPGFLGFFAAGAALVLATGVARLKMPRFPLHPLPMLLLGSWLMSRYFYAFLIGWLIKVTLVKIGGVRLFEASRPLLVGVVVGQAAVALVWVLIHIALFVQNGFEFQPQWLQFMRDMYSS